MRIGNVLFVGQHEVAVGTGMVVEGRSSRPSATAADAAVENKPEGSKGIVGTEMQVASLTSRKIVFTHVSGNLSSLLLREAGGK